MTEKNNHIENTRLDKIEKKAIYSVNETYFDNLPTRIQERVIELERQKQPAFVMSRALKFALPVIAIVIMSIYFGIRFENAPVDVQAMIDEVATEELVAYLNDSELSTEEILSLIDISELDIDGMYNEDIEFVEDTDLDEFMDMYPEFENDI